MANTSAIFKGAYTFLLTKSGLGLEAGQKVKYTDGAAVGSIPVSDVNGVLSLTAWSAINTGLTQGSVVFVGASGVLSQDNSKFFWDNTNKRLGVGGVPSYSLHLHTSAVDEARIYAVTGGSSLQDVMGLYKVGLSSNFRVTFGGLANNNDHAVASISGSGYAYHNINRGTVNESSGVQYQTAGANDWFMGTIETSRRYRWYSYGTSSPVMELGYDAADCRLIVRGAAGQTGCMQQWEDSSANVLARVGSVGQAKFTGLCLGTRIINFSTNLVANDYTALVDASSGAITISLPAVAGEVGRVYIIKKTDATANTVTIDANASETIDGQLTQTISSQYSFIKIQSNGIGWHIIG
jgi:hypothetical protein